MLTTFLELSDITDSPKVRTELPLLRIGDKITLRFCLERHNKGRREILDVIGGYQVTSIEIELKSQTVRISSTGKAPAWKAVKNQPPLKIAPAKAPPTIIK